MVWPIIYRRGYKCTKHITKKKNSDYATLSNMPPKPNASDPPLREPSARKRVPNRLYDQNGSTAKKIRVDPPSRKDQAHQDQGNQPATAPSSQDRHETQQHPDVINMVDTDVDEIKEIVKELTDNEKLGESDKSFSNISS